MTLMKTWLPPILSFLLFATAIYWADAQSAGSPASNGASHAAAESGDVADIVTRHTLTAAATGGRRPDRDVRSWK